MTLDDRLQLVEIHLKSLIDEVHEAREELAEHEKPDHDDNPSS